MRPPRPRSTRISRETAPGTRSRTKECRRRRARDDAAPPALPRHPLSSRRETATTCHSSVHRRRGAVHGTKGPFTAWWRSAEEPARSWCGTRRNLARRGRTRNIAPLRERCSHLAFCRCDGPGRADGRPSPIRTRTRSHLMQIRIYATRVPHVGSDVGTVPPPTTQALW